MRDNTAEVRARGIVNFLIKSGKVEKRACEICGKKDGRIEAHHDDYNKPKDIRWLCVLCHKERHKHNEPIRASIEKKCSICGKKFTSSGRRRKYCSDACAYAAVLKTNKKSRTRMAERNKTLHIENMPLTECLICGNPFKPIFGRKYCSDECRRKARLAQKREEYSRHKDRYAKNFKKYKLKLKERKRC